MPETTKNYHRIPVANKKKGNPIRTITLGKGIKALYDPKRKIIITFLFDVNKYTMREAKEWVKKYKNSASISAGNIALLETLKEHYNSLKNDVLDHLNINVEGGN